MGDNSRSPRNTTAIPALRAPAVKIAAGFKHSVVLLNNGELYVFGQGYSGDGTNYDRPYPSMVDMRTVRFIKNFYVTDIVGGFKSTMFMVSGDDAKDVLFSFGDNGT